MWFCFWFISSFYCNQKTICCKREQKDIVLMLFFVAHVSSSLNRKQAKILMVKKVWKISIFKSGKLSLKCKIVLNTYFSFKRNKEECRLENSEQILMSGLSPTFNMQYRPFLLVFRQSLVELLFVMPFCPAAWSWACLRFVFGNFLFWKLSLSVSCLGERPLLSDPDSLQMLEHHVAF